MSNKRTYYACQRVGIAPLGSTSYTTLRGVQSLGMTTTFNLTQAFEYGQLSIYENIEGLPDVEVSVEKVIDGYCPVYVLATQQGTSAGLAGRSNARCSLALTIYPDTDQVASGVSTEACVELSGLYVNSIGYTARAEANITESVSFVGNNKVWKTAGTNVTYGDNPWLTTASPASGVQRRQHVQMGPNGSQFPNDIPGITGNYNKLEGGEYTAHINSLSARTNLGRDQLFELGRRGPYHRFVRFPTEVTAEIGIIASAGDGVSATEEGIYGDNSDTCTNGYNLTDQPIKYMFCDGLIVDLGIKNKLASIGMTGGDAGGGNVEVTYTYQNFNDFSVMHPQDPRYADAGFHP